MFLLILNFILMEQLSVIQMSLLILKYVLFVSSVSKECNGLDGSFSYNTYEPQDQSTICSLISISF